MLSGLFKKQIKKSKIKKSQIKSFFFRNLQQNTALGQLLLYIALAVVLLSVLTYLVQERLIFKPEKLKHDFRFEYDIPFEIGRASCRERV